MHIGQARPDASSFQRLGNRGNSGPWASPPSGTASYKARVKILLEPIFEGNSDMSYGFRPGRNTHGALEYIRRAALPQKRDKDTRRNRLPYPWSLRATSKDASTISIIITCLNGCESASVIRRVVRLVGLFLKAGVLTEDQFLRTDAVTPQGGDHLTFARKQSP